MDEIERSGTRTALLVGVGGMRRAAEGVIEHATAEQVHIAAAVDVTARSDCPWPFVQADGQALPFRSGSIDLIVSNAVIEHVGGKGDQEQLVAELRRVAATSVISTPNRWSPVESYTGAVLAHWRPSWRQRQTLFSRLLSRSEFRDLLPPLAKMAGGPLRGTFTAVVPGDR